MNKEDYSILEDAISTFKSLATTGDMRSKHTLAVGDHLSSLLEKDNLLGDTKIHGLWYAREDLKAAGYLHDIGYYHPNKKFHPVDGADYLRLTGMNLAVLSLVAWHSTARAEGRYRKVAINYPEPPTEYAAYLFIADFITSPRGELVSVYDRVNDIVDRYKGKDDLVIRSMQDSLGLLRESLELVSGRVADATVDDSLARYDQIRTAVNEALQA